MIEYIVAALDFLDNEMVVKIVEAASWKDALAQHPLFLGGVSWLSDDLEIAKDDAFEANIVFTVVEKIDEGI